MTEVEENLLQTPSKRMGRDQHTTTNESSLTNVNEQTENMNLEAALTKVGGFGLFQTIVTISMGLVRNSGSALVYLFAYMVLPQKYECKTDPNGEFKSCDAGEYICPALSDGKLIEYRVDQSYEYFLSNWQQQMGLMCMSMAKVNFLIVIWFIMFGLGGFLTFPITDKIGRRKTTIIFATSHAFAQALILFQSSYLLRIIGFSLMGFLSATKNSAVYPWLYEFMQQKNKSLASSCLNSGDFATVMIAGIYFLYISQDCAPLLICIYCVNLTGLIVTLSVCPESPQWLML